MAKIVHISRTGGVTVIGPTYCGFDGNVCSFDQAKCTTAREIVCKRQKHVFEWNLPKKDVKVGHEFIGEGSVTRFCPKCGAPDLSKWIQTTKHIKKRKTQATVYECHKCRKFFVITIKVVNIREVKNGTSDRIWTEIKPEDLKY
jgi:predicted RNA-binding Zn-ribbon protein involved in translation (DUF1610 family)